MNVLIESSSIIYFTLNIHVNTEGYYLRCNGKKLFEIGVAFQQFVNHLLSFDFYLFASCNVF